MRHPDSPFPRCDMHDRPQGSNSPSCPTCHGDLEQCWWHQQWVKDAEERKARAEREAADG